MASISPRCRGFEYASGPGPSNARYPLRQLWTGQALRRHHHYFVPSQYGIWWAKAPSRVQPRSSLIILRWTTPRLWYSGHEQKGQRERGSGKGIQAAKTAEGEYQAGLRLRPPSISSPKTGSWGICAILAECGKSEIVKGKESERWRKSGGQ